MSIRPVGLVNLDVFNTWTRSDHKLHINSLELKAVILALSHLGSVLWGHQVMIATDNTRPTVVVSYINKQGGTHSHSLLRLVVVLFLWLQTQDIAIRARHIPGYLNVIANCLSRPNQPITTEWSLHPEIVNRSSGHGELQQWTCLPQSTTRIFPSLCLQFWSLWSL